MHLSTNYPAPGDIVIFQPQFVEFGGEERVILSLARELNAQGKAHSVVCYTDSIDLASFASWPLKVHQLNPGPSPLRRVLALRSMLASLHKCGSPTPALFNIQSSYHAGLASATRYHLRIPDTYRLLVTGPEGLHIQRKTLIGKLHEMVATHTAHWATGRGIRKSNQFVTNTMSLSDEMAKLYDRKAEVIYLGGFGGPNEEVFKEFVEPVQLLTVSRLQTSKRIDWILHAMAQVLRNQSTYPTCFLHIVGGGPDEIALKQLSASLGLENFVRFHGFVADETLKSLYESCHVFVMPAKQGYGLPAIEALYQKMAVVVSDESGVVEILGNTPWVSVATGGKEGFTNAMQELLLRVKSPGFFDQALPALPTETQWAQNIIRHFDW